MNILYIFKGVEGHQSKRATRAHTRVLHTRITIMAKIEQWIIDKVRDAADIENVVGDFVRLRRAGVNRTGICPFHDDTNDGNFIVRPKNASKYGNTWHCFVCDDGGGVVEFLKKMGMSFPEAIRWLGRKYSIEVDDVPVDFVPPPPKPAPPPLPVLAIPRDWVKATMDKREDNTFTRWFRGLPWSDEQRGRITDTLWQYCVGHYKEDGSTVFWQIDDAGVPRAAKLMKYQEDGHRMKGKFDTSYIYAKPECRAILNPDGHEILHPLFGAHLLKRYPSATVNVVESEKTALVLANFYGMPHEQLFLACGGLQWLKLESMQPLIDQQRKVWLWPDKDGVAAWQAITEKLGSDRVNVYTTFFDTCWRPEDGDKADAADIIIRMMATHDAPRAMGETTSKSTTEAYHTGSPVNPAEPFFDDDELKDLRIREWRETIRQRYNFRHQQTPPPQEIEGVKTVGEIIKNHPLMQKLLRHETQT